MRLGKLKYLHRGVLVFGSHARAEQAKRGAQKNNNMPF